MALTADEVQMNRGAFLMIHNAHALCVGDRDDMTHMADVLRQVDKNIVNDYASKTGIDPDEIQDMMNEETWLDCDDCLNKGFIDRISEDQKAENRFDLSIYAKAPEALRTKSKPVVIQSSAERERCLRTIESRWASPRSASVPSSRLQFFSGGVYVMGMRDAQEVLPGNLRSLMAKESCFLDPAGINVRVGGPDKCVGASGR